MGSLIQIKHNKIYDADSKIINYLNPDFIYIPYEKGFNLNIKTKEKVLKDSILLIKDNKYIYSPISGNVLGATKMIINKQIGPCIVIENDFKETNNKIISAKKSIYDYQKDEVNKLIKEYNAFNKNLDGNTILINGIDLEIYEGTYKSIINKYSSEILEIIDAINDIFKCHKCILAIKNNDSEIIEKLVYQIGTYPNIELKLMPDLYPLGHKDILIEELNLLKNNYKIIYLTIEDVLAIYNVLRRKKPITEKIITISGNAIEKAKIMNVKIGTSLKDILNNNIKIINDNYKIIINGLLSGYEVESKDFIITKNIKSIFINTLDQEGAKECINCGLCHRKCPVGCDVRNNFKLEKCLNCGICTYICPSKINFKDRTVK
ncbi:MAG: hypothetical protein PHS24_01865 [Bacilli bacterium]|nr:hypothetical protein [Bacilli bacterium]